MHRFLLLAVFTTTASIAQNNLGFEEGSPGEVPPGWLAPKSIKGYADKISAEAPKAGKYCAEISWTGDGETSPFGNLMQRFDANAYRGKRVRFRAAVRLAEAATSGDHAQLWFRVDRPDQVMGFFDNMGDRPISAKSWQYYDITGDIEPDAVTLNIGLMLFGHSKVFFDDVSVEILGDTPESKAIPLPAGPQQQTAWDRMAAISKLWVYVKYFHPGVTAPGIDWDQAFADAVPKVLATASDGEFEAAVNDLLAALHDPSTRVTKPARPLGLALSAADGQPEVKIARWSPGGSESSREAGESLRHNLGGAHAVVFDLRDIDTTTLHLPDTLPVAVDSPMAPLKFRVHEGYQGQGGGNGYQGYKSTWETQNDAHPLIAAAKPIRAVYLVNRRTVVPPIALALQASGAGAIVSEDELRDAPLALGSTVHASNLEVHVRTYQPAYADGTTGLAANIVLNKSGEEALKAAVEIAAAGKWAPPVGRPKLELPPAVYTEKQAGPMYPGTEWRLLAAARIWGVFHYFHPYKYLYGEDWDTVLLDFLPRMAQAKTAREYHLAVAEMVAHTHDTHCYVSSGELGAFYGTPPAVSVRWIENQVVVTRVADPQLAGQLHPGDVVLKVDGKPVRTRLDELEPRIAASNSPSMMSRTMQLVLAGRPSSSARLTVRGSDGAEREVPVQRSQESYKLLYPERGGEVSYLVNPKIGYTDLARLKNEDVDAMFEKFKDTGTIIMDMRGYPNGTAWSVAPRLAEHSESVAASFRTNIVRADVDGGIKSEEFVQRIPPTNKARYRGKTILLIDERTMSQAEHSGLFYRAANGTVFIGSPTQGANGDVTGFVVPGMIHINFSGHDVRWPDGRQLQRAGLHPDVAVLPTLAGIRAGRDEVLERAVKYAEEGK